MYKRQAGSRALDDDLEDLRGRAGIAMLKLDRPPNAQGLSHGGVAIAYNENKCSFTTVNIRNPDSWEVLVGCGQFVGFSRPVLVVACYVPPGYPVPKGSACVAYIRDVVTELKRKYDDPYITVAGDLNQWEIGAALGNFPDLLEVCLLYTSPSPRD